MPVYEYQGKYYELSETDPAAAKSKILAHLGQAPKPATGLFAAAGKGLESLIGAGTTAVGATFGSPEEAARAALTRQKQMEEKYADQVSLEKVKEAYEKRGILSAAGEALSQIPYALAEQAPNLAATIGGAKLGAMAGTAVAPGAGSALGAIIGGGLGAFAPSFVQQYGGNIERQAAEQEKAGKPLDISRTAAAAAAGPQAALDVAATFIPLGRTVAGKVLGPEVKALLERGQKEAAEKIAKESLGKTLAKGTLIGGAAEVPTEVTQQVLERAQAGLSLTDDDALKEYGETAYQVGLLAPLGAAGRVTDRSAAKGQIAAEAATAEAAKRKAARDAEEAKKKSPEYLLELDKRYADAVSQMRQMQEAVKAKPGKDAAPDERMEYQQRVEALKSFINDTMRPLTAEYTPRKAEIAQLKERQRVEGMTPLEYQMEQAGVDLTAPPKEERVFTGEDEITPPPEAPTPATAYAEKQLALADEQAFVNEMDVKDRPAAYIPYLMQDPAMAQALVTANAPIPGLKKRESNAVLSGLKLQLDALGGQMAAGREAAGYERQQTDIEQQVAREQAARLAATQQQLELEGTAEREAMQEVAAERASDMRARELQALQTAQQTTLFPEGTRVETRPKGTLPERFDTLAERILAAPNVDEGTKDLVQQIQGNLPQVAAQLRAQTEALAQRAPQRGVAPRVTPRGVPQGDEEAQIANWAQSVLQGRAMPEMTADLRSAVQALQAGRRSETEQVTQYAGRALTPQEKQDVAGTSLEGRQGVMTREPTGEVRRAVQTEIAMPEPTAKAFESFGAFNDYLASEGLQAYRTQKGMVFPTLANLQKRLAPIQARVAELQKQLDDVNAKREALQKADAAERGAASALLRESQQKLQSVVRTLDDTARTTYVGAKLKQVDLVDLLDEAHGRLNVALSLSANLRTQFAQALSKIASAEEATKPVMVDANGNATTKEKSAVRTVAMGQLPGYQALRKAQLDLQAKGNALVEADRKLEEVVKAGIGQSWDAGSPTLTAYLKAKQAKDEAQRAAQQAHFAMLQAHRRIPSTEALNNNLSKFLAEKGSIDTEMAKAAKSLSAIRLGVRNASNRLNDAYVRMENNPELRFGENLLRLRQDLLAAQNISEEAMGRSVERQAQAEDLAKEAKVIAQPMRTMERQVSTALKEARERAEARRGVPAKETQADREARDAEARREEQARLERKEAEPATRIEFERSEPENREIKRLMEAVAEAPTTEERAAARKALDEYLKAFIARKDAELEEMKRRAAKNVQDLNTQRRAVAELTERLKGDLTPKRRESAEKQLAEAKRKLAEHERRYTLNTREMKITRTDVQAQRQERNRLLAEALRRREEGERLGEVEGTQQRAIGPVTRPEVSPPKALRTESPESRAGLTATDTRQKLTEARGEKQRDVAMTAKEMKAAQDAADKMKTLEGLKSAEKALADAREAARARGLRPGEFDRFEAREAILAARRKTLEREAAMAASKKPAETKPVVEAVEPEEEVEEVPAKKRGRKAKAIDEMETELDSFEIEILPGENQEVFFSRGATPNPSTTASVRTELKKAFPDLGRVQIFDSVDALIAANPQYEGRIPSDARGFVDTAGNKAFLIAENINQGQALSVLLHEVGAHIGLKNMLGTAQYNALVKAVETWAKKNDGSIESRVAKAAQARVEAAKTPASQKADETLAYAIEEAVNAGVKPLETKGVLGQWMSQIATLFRKALEKFGVAPEKLDAQGLVDLAFGAAQIEMAPKVPQMSRRQFLRGAGAALGAMKLPQLPKEAQIDALEAAWEGSIEAARTWFDTAEVAAKTPALKALIRANNFFDIDKENVATALYNTSEDLYNHMHYLDYGSLATEEEYRYWTRSYLEEKGVKAVAELQSALKDLYGKILTEAKGTKAPEVGELFFSGTEKPSAFKRWFGDSKVVDAQGKPLVVYHGTDKDFTTFDAEKPKTSGAMHGKGFYFADAAQASSYADAPSGGGLVMPVYLKMERPFIGKLTAKDIALLRKETPEFDAAYKKFVAEEGTDEYTPSIERLGVLSGNRNEFIQKALRAAGYDGRIVTDEPSAPWTDPDTEYVVFEPTQIKSATGNRGTYDPTSPNILFSRNLPTAARVADQLVGQQKGWLQKLRENFLGIGGRTQFVDMRFPLEEALKKGGVEDLDAMQAMYYVRMYDQKMHFTSEAITEGVPEVVEKTRKDGRTERIIEAKAGANLTQAYKILTSKEVIKEAGSADAANKLVTLYMAAIRGANKGYDKLNFGRAWATEEIKRLDGQINAKDTTPEERTNLQKRRKALDDRLDTMPTPEDIKASRAEIEANPVLREAFDKVREVYNEYNRNLLQLAVQTGAISKDHARTLLAQNDYIPYYRMRGGVAEMVIGDETPIRIGNIKDNQELQELVGGDEPILDFITSSMQNTSMLVDMSLRNIAMKNAMFELREVGLATVAKAPKGGAPKGSVTFKKDGEDYYAVVNTDALGVSSELLVKGLAGIPTMFPMWVRAMGIPARFLRRAIVAAPPYWAKQVFRDSLGAAMSSGADIVPVLGALRQIGKDNVLERRGITGGQVFTGLPEDKKRMLDAMQAGKVSLTRGMAWLEATAAKADALTRKNQYENYLAQGLSEMEATYMALESMNFSKRGLSPSVHYANILIPFFNSQIQGLDALYKAFTGKMPMNERLEIRQKLWTRGMFMFAMSMAYAWAMQDDEAYKNAKPDEKYGNWFVPLKHFGIDETLRLPIPFELGYIFKGIPEAIVNSVMREEGAKEARDAFTHIAQQTVPGGSSLGIPAAAKTGLEATLGVSLYTMRPIESAQEQMLEPGYRTRENTTELARQIGEMTNFSPIKLEFLVRGYTGSMGMAALAALSAPLGGTGPTPATKRLTDTPIFGTLFQPKDASGIIDATYERLNKVNQLVKTHEDLLNKGRVADAEKYFAEHQDDMALGSLAGSFKEYMGQITAFERDVRASNMTPEKKREYLDYLRQVKIQAATSVRDSVRAASGKTTPQSAPA
jgi:hypothetical protein